MYMVFNVIYVIFNVIQLLKKKKVGCIYADTTVFKKYSNAQLAFRSKLMLLPV